MSKYTSLQMQVQSISSTNCIDLAQTHDLPSVRKWDCGILNAQNLSPGWIPLSPLGKTGRWGVNWGYCFIIRKTSFNETGWTQLRVRRFTSSFGSGATFSCRPRPPRLHHFSVTLKCWDAISQWNSNTRIKFLWTTFIKRCFQISKSKTKNRNGN